MSVRETELGEDHPDCIATRHNIAELYIMWANPEKAQEYLQMNIDIMEKRQAADQAKKDKTDEEKNEKESSYF